MNTIKFSHLYTKIPIDISCERVKSAILLHVFKVHSSELGKEFVEYDTAFWDEIKGKDDYYNLPTGEVIVLLLVSTVSDSNDKMLWTTIRRHTQEKEKYYRSLIGQEVEIEIIEVKL